MRHTCHQSYPPPIGGFLEPCSGYTQTANEQERSADLFPYFLPFLFPDPRFRQLFGLHRRSLQLVSEKKSRLRDIAGFARYDIGSGSPDGSLPIVVDLRWASISESCSIRSQGISLLLAKQSVYGSVRVAYRQNRYAHGEKKRACCYSQIRGYIVDSAQIIVAGIPSRTNWPLCYMPGAGGGGGG